MTSQSIRLEVKITPGSSLNQIVGFRDDILHVKIAAPPVRGKANKELIDFLSDVLGIRKSCVSILKGETSHHKVISISGLSHDEISRRLSPGGI